MKKSVNYFIVVLTVLLIMLGTSCSNQKKAEKAALKLFDTYYVKSPEDLIRDFYKTEITLEDLKTIFKDEYAEIMFYRLQKFSAEDKEYQIESILKEKYIQFEDDSILYNYNVPFKGRNDPYIRDEYENKPIIVYAGTFFDNYEINHKTQLVRLGIGTQDFDFLYVNKKLILEDQIFFGLDINNDDPEILSSQLEAERIEMLRSKIHFKSPNTIDLSTFFDYNSQSEYGKCYDWDNVTHLVSKDAIDMFFDLMMVGIHQNLRWGDLPTAWDNGDYNWADIENFLGIKVILSKDKKTGLNQYNPELIKWITNNLIPDPKSKGLTLNRLVIKSQLFQDAYNFYLQKLAREYALVFKNLKENQMIESERDLYIKEMHKKGFEGYEYLAKKYPGINAYIYGFWLRRSMDGTIDECWDGLKKVLKSYDKDFFEKNVIGY